MRPVSTFFDIQLSNSRAAIVFAIAGNGNFFQVCLSDPAAWIAALIPLIPYYFWVMKKSGER